MAYRRDKVRRQRRRLRLLGYPLRLWHPHGGGRCQWGLEHTGDTRHNRRPNHGKYEHYKCGGFDYNGSSTARLVSDGDDNNKLALSQEFVADYVTAQLPDSLSIAELSSLRHVQKGKMKISPNPFEDQVSISLQLPIETPLVIQVFDNLGREVAREDFPMAPVGHWNYVWTPQNLLEPGMYWVVVTLQDGSKYSERLIKK